MHLKHFSPLGEGCPMLMFLTSCLTTSPKSLCREPRLRKDSRQWCQKIPPSEISSPTILIVGVHLLSETRISVAITYVSVSDMAGLLTFKSLRSLYVFNDFFKYIYSGKESCHISTYLTNINSLSTSPCNKEKFVWFSKYLNQTYVCHPNWDSFEWKRILFIIILEQQV